MPKITIQATYEIETEHTLDDASVKAIATAMTEGMQENVDDQTVVEVTEMIATFQTTVSLMPEKAVVPETETMGYDGQ